MNSRHPETAARGWGGSEPQLLTPFPLDQTDSGGSAGSGGEFLTPDSVRSLFNFSALGAPGSSQNLKKPKENQCFWLQPSKNLRKINVFLPLGFHPSPPGCASQARNPVRPNVGHFFHQMGRHPTILDIRGGVLHRIPLRISPDRSNPLNLNFFLTIFWTKNQKKLFSGRKKTPLRGTLQLPWRAWSQIRPIGAQGAHVAPFWSNSAP